MYNNIRNIYIDACTTVIEESKYIHIYKIKIQDTNTVTHSSFIGEHRNEPGLIVVYRLEP